MAGLTQSQIESVKASRDKQRTAKKDRDEVPTQRTRAAIQGLSFGFGDEIEAGLRSPFDSKKRAATLDKVRGDIKAYQAARPIESLAYEVGGAAAPALFTFGATAPASAAATGARVGSRYLPAALRGTGILSTAGRGAVIGAGQGGLYAAGTGEGGAADRLKRVPGGAVGGAAAGAGGSVVLGGVANLSGKLVDIARQKLGAGGSRAVTAELQRLATESGKTVDDIAADLASGRIMAENATLADAVRNLARMVGGEAQADMRQGLTARTAGTFDDAKGQIQKYLADTGDDNVRRAVRRSDDTARTAERLAYSQFETGSVGQEVQDQVGKAIRSIPSAADDIQTALRARGAQPLFNMVDGAPVFTRAPTPMEAEIVRRSISDSTTAAYRNSRGTVGAAFGDVEQGLRSSIDDGIEGMRGVRADASALRTSRDAFVGGQKSITSGADQVQIDFAALPTDDAIASYRAGFMDELRKRFRGGTPASIMKQLNSEERNIGAILRTVFPDEQMEDVLRRIDIADAGQSIKGYALGQSATAPTQAAAERAGGSFNAEEMAGAASGSIMDMGRVLSRFIGRDGAKLTDAQNKEVVRVLLSENADFVRAAMTDKTGWGALDRAVTQTLTRIADGGTRAATIGGAQAGMGLLSPQGPR